MKVSASRSVCFTRGRSPLYPLDRTYITSTLKIETECFCETLVTTYKAHGVITQKTTIQTVTAMETSSNILTNVARFLNDRQISNNQILNGLLRNTS